MAMPYALLRAGFPYVKTLGMRRVTDAPVDVAVGSDDNVYVLGRLPGPSPIRKLTWDDDFLGPVGAPEAAFEWPVAIAMDAEDNIYVSDEAAHRITVITSDGKLVGSWGERGEGQGELNGPSGIALDLDGNLYVSDTLNHRVQRFTKEGRFLSSWGSFGTGPASSTCHGAWPSTRWETCTSSTGATTACRSSTPTGVSSASSVVRAAAPASSTGRPASPRTATATSTWPIWATTGSQMFDRDGRYLQTFTGDGTLSKSARQYILANAKVLRLRSMADLEPEKSFIAPTSLTVDGRGRMVVIDNGHSRVQVYQKDAIPLDETQLAPPPRVPTQDTV